MNQLTIAVSSDTLTSRQSRGDTKTWPSASKIYELPAPAVGVVMHCGEVAIGQTSWRLIVREWSRHSGGLGGATMTSLRDSFSAWVTANSGRLGLTDDDGVWSRLGPFERDRGHIGWLANYLPMDLRQAYFSDPNGNDAAMATAIRKVVADNYATDPFPDIDVDKAKALIEHAKVDLVANFKRSLDQDDAFEVHKESAAAVEEFAIAALRCIPTWERGGVDLHFVGYGAGEVLGQIAKLAVLGFWGGQLRASTRELGSTVPGEYPFFYPIAQTTAIDAFWTGSSGDFDHAVERAARGAFGAINGLKVEDVEKAITAMNDEISSFSRDRYRIPMFQTIDGLGISNLGKFADFLLHLQAFRSATDEGEATVGGFVESLVITPEHGVQWRHRISDGIHEISNSSHAFE